MNLDLGFGLDHAGWPAFVVDASGFVRQANQSAVQTFGTVMEGGPALSASIWTLENEVTPEEFVAKSERSSAPMTLLTFRVKGGGTARFNTYLCSQVRDGQKFYLFQLIRETAPAQPSHPIRASASYSSAADR